jgi:OmpA-OmpF porin, OOP family
MKTWVIGILVFLMWSAGSTYWYVCKVKGICWEASTLATNTATAILKEPQPATSAADSVPTDAISASDGTASEATSANPSTTTAAANPKALAPDIAQPHTVLFAFAGPLPENPSAFEDYLDAIAAHLKQHPTAKCLVKGYTDDTAARENNIKLAQRRCNVIVAKLAERGIAIGQIVTEPLGEADPVATNDTPAGRRLNRRVVISIQP